MKILITILVVIFMCIAINSFASVDLTQCGINNNLAICSQTIAKKEAIKVRQALAKEREAETEDTSISVNQFFSGLVNLVQNQNIEAKEQDIITKITIEDDNASVLVMDYYNMYRDFNEWKSKSNRH